MTFIPCNPGGGGHGYFFTVAPQQLRFGWNRFLHLAFFFKILLRIKNKIADFEMK